MPLRLFQLRARFKSDPQLSKDWNSDSADPAAAFPFPKFLIAAAAIFGIGGAAVGLFFLPTPQPHPQTTEPAVASSSKAQFNTVQVPARIAELGFSLKLPTDFNAVPLPPDEPNFNEPDFFFPLYIAMPSYAAVVFSAAARPAYEDGSVEDWARYHAGRQEGTLKSIQPGKIGALDAIIGDATMPSEAGTMRMRYCFFEDGGRMVIVSVMAPEQLWPGVEATLQTMIDSFTLETPKGQTRPLTRAAAQAESPTPTASAGEPTSAASVALADDAAALDQDNPINARLRDNGIGLVPRVIEVNKEDKYAILGAGAIQSTFRIPLGWHAMDDGKRTLIFDPENKVQVNLDLRKCAADPRSFLQGLLKEHLGQQADIEHMTMDLSGMQCLSLRNYRVEGEVLQQAFLVKDVGDKAYAVVARITADDDNMVRAMNVAEVILTNLSRGK